MFDDGYKKTWIRKGLADELRLNGTKETVVVTTFGQSVGKPVTSRKVEFYLAADKEGNNWVKVKALAVDDLGAPVNKSYPKCMAPSWPDQIRRELPKRNEICRCLNRTGF